MSRSMELAQQWSILKLVQYYSMLNSTHNIEINVSIRTIHQSRTQRGQAENQIQRTLVTTVGETAENFNQDQHHSIEALSEPETMHTSTMNQYDNHTRSSNINRRITRSSLELLSFPIDSSSSVTNGGASRTTAQRTIFTKIRRSNGPVSLPPQNGRN